MKKLLLFISLICFQQTFSQITPEQEATLADMMIKKVNALRQQKGIYALQRNENLKEAAKFHADFMSSKKRVTHTQENALYKTSIDRVHYYTKDFNTVGENIIKTKRIPAPFHTRKLAFVINIIYNSWKKSPENYKNMISSSYSYIDMGVAYNNETKQFFVSLVFGNKKHKVANQLSEFAFGIKSGDNKCNNLSKEVQNIHTNLGNSLVIENNEVFLNYNSKNDVIKILTTENDGFAIDLVERSQMKCSAANLLDASPIHDGVLLKPIYKNELLSSNQGLNNTFKVSLGKIPNTLQGNDISANLVILKQNSLCSYRVPNSIPKTRFKLLTVVPELEVPDIDLLNQGIRIAKEVFFEFETSKTTTDIFTEANFDLDNVHSFDIKSYTSIDGSERANKVIQDKRAEFIKQHIGNVLGFSLDFTKINIDARANWPLFDYQLELYGYKDKLSLSKTAKRAFANSTLKNSWDEQFAKQRKSKLIAFQHGYWNIKNRQHGFYNLLNGLITDEVHLVNKSLVHLFHQDGVNYNLDKDFILDKLLRNKDLVQNVSALFTKNLEEYNIDYIIYFINYWLPKAESLNPDAQKNLLNLYSHTTYKILQNWNENSKHAARILHPDNVETLFKTYKAQSTIDAVYLNYHMTKVEYYNKLNQKDKIKKSFDFVTSNYEKNAKTIDDKIVLASFFNVWNSYDNAKQLLLIANENNTLNEDATFMLAKTLIVDHENNEEILAKLQEKAINFNKERWCNWITKDFQNLRIKNIKDLYCSSCKK